MRQSRRRGQSHRRRCSGSSGCSTPHCQSRRRRNKRTGRRRRLQVLRQRRRRCRRRRRGRFQSEAQSRLRRGCRIGRANQWRRQRCRQRRSWTASSTSAAVSSTATTTTATTTTASTAGRSRPSPRRWGKAKAPAEAPHPRWHGLSLRPCAFKHDRSSVCESERGQHAFIALAN
jgi:hypothetical protein